MSLRVSAGRRGSGPPRRGVVARGAGALLLATLLGAACSPATRRGGGGLGPDRARSAAGGEGEGGTGARAAEGTAASRSARPRMSPVAAQAYAVGMKAFMAGDLEGARTQFLAAVQADPQAFAASYSLGVVRERLGDTAGARTAYRAALAVVPDYEPAIASYAVLTARLQGADAAEAFLRELQGRFEKSAAVVAALAEVKSMQGDSAEAQRLAQAALKLDPGYRPAMETLARDHYRNRRLDLALYALKGILDGYGPENPPRDKNNAQAHLLRGLIYEEQGHRREAIAELQQALALRPDLVEARIRLARQLLETGNAAAAAPLLEGALRYDRGNVVAHLCLGDAYRLLGKTAEALREFEWVRSVAPDLVEVHYDLGLLYLFSEQVPGLSDLRATELAIECFETYKAKRPRSAPGGVPDDTDELITRAKARKGVLEAEAAAPPPEPEASPEPAAPPPPPAGSAALQDATATPPPPPAPQPAEPVPDADAAPPTAGEPPDEGGSSGSLPPLEGGQP